MALSPTAQRVQDLLRQAGSACVIIEYTESTRTSQEAADRAGCTLGQITKSLIFKGKISEQAVLVLASGSNRVDEKRIGGYAGEPIMRPDADFVRTATGFAIGGVPPFGHMQTMPTFIDEDLLQYSTIWAAGGTHNAIFELTPDELLRLTAGKVVQVK